jgi:hypothetical protein
MNNEVSLTFMAEKENAGVDTDLHG